MFEGPSTAEWAASDASHARKRTEVIEKRLELLKAATATLFKTAAGEASFLKQWADCDPPPPPYQPIDWSQWPETDPYRRCLRNSKLGG